VRARSSSLELDLTFDVMSIESTRMANGLFGGGLNFLQMRGQYTVTGRAGARQINFSAPGTAETFRGQ